MITTKPNIVSNVAGLESKQFSIKVTEKSFRILLDGLYTDKIKSIIRELWTNAYDSHVAAGCPDKPFTCFVPTPLTNEFKVRDYGVSMTHEQVMDFYSRLFDTTKDDTNDQIGCWGLGSKTPFSYTDSFTVKTFSGTERRVYLAALNSEGIPTITHLNTIPCDEPRGVEVAVAVSDNDFSEFERKVREVAVGFDPVPETNISLNASKNKLFECDDLIVTSSTEYNARFYVKQGPVIYPLPSDLYRELDIHPTSLNLRYVDYIFNVPVGSVDFTASREALQITDRTKEFLLNFCRPTLDAVTEAAVEEILSQPNTLQATNAYVSWREILCGLITSKQLWLSQDSKNRVDGYLRYHVHFEEDILHLSTSKNRRTYERIKTSNDLEISPAVARNTTFVVDRGQKIKRKKLRIATYLHENAGYSTPVYLLTDPTTRHIERLIRLFGLRKDQFISVTSLPDVEVVRNGSSGNGDAPDPDALQGVWSFKHDGDRLSATRPYHKSQISTDYLFYELETARVGTKINLPIKGVPWVFPLNEEDWDFRMFIRGVFNFLDFEGEVLFIGPRAKAKLNPREDQHLRTGLEKLILDKKDKLRDIIAANKSTFHTPFYNEVVEQALGISSTSQREDLPFWLKRVTDKMDEFKDIEPLHKGLEEKYPLLFSSYPEPEAVREYIQLMDNKRGN